ncbi:6,7-dimethyl-8-ribityllumazine synthase [Bradyrhizobium sp. ARR65]|uniref:6,7-dimethyl-8-ribityllumazine synthase n=1 Tax=Bradyrhizobium sp. ARR65 TaxID=1040989 RepID=UPI0004679BD8|nr:6,7-dimethyl-8-ribityllumazine synthase [Bradyrhizobium sp. ARR65]
MNQMLQDPQVQDSQLQNPQIQGSQIQGSQIEESQVLEASAQGAGVSAGDAPPRPQHPRFAKPQRVAFVQSSWHRDVVMEARIAFLDEIEARHIARERVDIFEVPGSFEIPLHAQILAKTRRYTAIVAAGLVVDGGIYRHEFVADTVIKALMDVQLRTEVPVFSAVLTPQQFHETQAHFEFFKKHFATKGVEVAEACANTLLSLERLRGQVAAGIVAGG